MYLDHIKHKSLSAKKILHARRLEESIYTLQRPKEKDVSLAGSSRTPTHWHPEVTHTCICACMYVYVYVCEMWNIIDGELNYFWLQGMWRRTLRRMRAFHKVEKRNQEKRLLGMRKLSCHNVLQWWNVVQGGNNSTSLVFVVLLYWTCSFSPFFLWHIQPGLRHILRDVTYHGFFGVLFQITHLEASENRLNFRCWQCHNFISPCHKHFSTCLSYFFGWSIIVKIMILILFIHVFTTLSIRSHFSSCTSCFFPGSFIGKTMILMPCVEVLVTWIAAGWLWSNCIW